jgi:molecular chaperone DnaK (HSP70)
MLPIEEVLKKAGVTIQDVDLVELIGGGIRVPKV